MRKHRISDAVAIHDWYTMQSLARPPRFPFRPRNAPQQHNEEEGGGELEDREILLAHGAQKIAFFSGVLNLNECGRRTSWRIARKKAIIDARSFGNDRNPSFSPPLLSWTNFALSLL